MRSKPAVRLERLSRRPCRLHADGHDVGRQPLENGSERRQDEGMVIDQKGLHGVVLC